MNTFWRLPSAVLFAGLLVLCGCSKSGNEAGQAAGGSAGSKDSQVVARVNGEEITIHQLNVALAAMPSNGQDADKIRRQVLRTIIYRTALRQAATKAGLDRNPEIAMQINAAKDRILAEAYMSQQTGGTPPPTASAINDFIAAHPLDFAERRIYQFSRLTIAADRYSDDMVPLFDQKQTFTAFENDLNQKHIPYTVTDIRLPSSEFPKHVQDQLTKFGVGDNIVVRGVQQIAVLKIKSWVDMPLGSAQATQIARTALHDRALANHAKTVREQVLHAANIQFLGQFAGMSLAPPMASEAAAPTGQAGLNGPDQTSTSNSPQGGQTQ